MIKIHRDILTQKRTDLMDNIGNPIEVLDKLFEYMIFTRAIKEEIEAEQTRTNKVRKILDYLPTRGPQAFETFYKSLLETGNERTTDYLDVPKSSIDLPEDWPDEKTMTETITVKQCNAQDVEIQKLWQSETVYSMKKPVRGRCLIFSNQNFSNLSERKGNERDIEGLRLLFTQLHFDVILYNDLTAADIHAELKKEAKFDHGQYECFVCVLCSHGGEGGVCGTDGKPIPVESITRCFDGKHCVTLRNKPKLFFIQACQGGKHDVNLEQTDISRQFENIRIRGDNTTDATKARFVHEKADNLIAYATHPRYVSFRHKYFGTWFIQALIYVFKKYACQEDILSLLAFVNKLVTRGKAKSEDNYDVGQAPMSHTSLTNKLYFFPGMTDGN